MSFRAKSLDDLEHASQNRIARKVEKKLVKKLMLHKRLEAIAEEVLPDVLPYTNGDERRARALARKWAMETLCMYIYHRTGGDLVFIE